MQEYKELQKLRSAVTSGQAILFEYVSAYRRVVVLQTGSAYQVRTTYKGLCRELKEWSTYWGDKAVATAWAETYAANREIILSGILTIKEAPGKRLI